MPDSSDDAEQAERRKHARALYASVLRHSREQAAERDPDVERITRVFDAAASESDRSAAILMFAFAEDMMAEGLKQNLNNNVKGGWEEAIGANGPLGTASHRITVLHMLD